jgi:hypothetical protein
MVASVLLCYCGNEWKCGLIATIYEGYNIQNIFVLLSFSVEIIG